MSDKRAYFHTDVGYFDNPKLADLVEDQPRAVILHLRAIAYCAQHLTDGVFPMRLVMRLACGSQCDLDALVQCGLINVLDETNAEVHDYLKHQRSAESVGKAKAAGQRAAAARWGAAADADRIADRTPDRNAEPNAKKEREKERSTHTAAVAAAFEEFWDTYPKPKRGRGAAEKSFARAVKRADLTTVMDGVRRLAADPNLPADRKFIPDATTWLNQDRWTDDPYPPRNGPQPIPERSLAERVVQW